MCETFIYCMGSVWHGFTNALQQFISDLRVLQPKAENFGSNSCSSSLRSLLLQNYIPHDGLDATFCSLPHEMSQEGTPTGFLRFPTQPGLHGLAPCDVFPLRWSALLWGLSRGQRGWSGCVQSFSDERADRQTDSGC